MCIGGCNMGFQNLIYCPDCDREVSIYTETCPHCGRPIKKYLEENDTKDISAICGKVLNRFYLSEMWGS